MKAISGIRPSGKLHLGNYIGSILPALKYDADVLIAEYHAPEFSHGKTSEATKLKHQLQRYFKPKRIKLQSKQFDAELFFNLLNVTPSGLLHHMPQYKEKEKTALMFTYPVLMAHDIAGYDLVIVGDDQRPHIEFAKDILHKVGRKCPEPIYEGGRVMDLRHPMSKMSKSEPNSCLFLSDSKEVRDKKIMKAATTALGRENLEFIYRALNTSKSPKYAQPPEGNQLLKEEIISLLDEHLGTR